MLHADAKAWRRGVALLLLCTLDIFGLRRYIFAFLRRTGAFDMSHRYLEPKEESVWIYPSLSCDASHPGGAKKMTDSSGSTMLT